ncbi:hypothetical protein SDC9_183134 [bioreactor metagenome]|uniref:Uncharacterized protein n=1 Tax=bioreactor metagenome TaxID=1076179 RepID=A0A645HAU1_9ZZZZ
MNAIRRSRTVNPGVGHADEFVFPFDPMRQTQTAAVNHLVTGLRFGGGVDEYGGADSAAQYDVVVFIAVDFVNSEVRLIPM